MGGKVKTGIVIRILTGTLAVAKAKARARVRVKRGGGRVRKGDPNDGECYECKRQGREFVHNFRDCEIRFMALNACGKGKGGKGTSGEPAVPPAAGI